ncbi:MAG: hypothetical protein WDA59_00050 [Methanofastidiosum sp.]|jgi:hypothetical protein
MKEDNEKKFNLIKGGKQDDHEEEDMCPDCRIRFEIVNLMTNNVLNNEMTLKEALNATYQIAFDFGIQDFLIQDIRIKERLLAEMNGFEDDDEDDE